MRTSTFLQSFLAAVHCSQPAAQHAHPAALLSYDHRTQLMLLLSLPCIATQVASCPSPSKQEKRRRFISMLSGTESDAPAAGASLFNQTATASMFNQSVLPESEPVLGLVGGALGLFKPVVERIDEVSSTVASATVHSSADVCYAQYVSCTVCVVHDA